MMTPPQLLFLLAFLVGTALSFAPSSLLNNRRHAAQIKSIPSTTTQPIVVLSAGGIEWKDPTSDQADPGVENPFKNPDPLVDPARLLSLRLCGCNLYLIGMMGSGKSAVGVALARRMGTYNFLDTDAILEEGTGVSIPKIFEEEGEAAFRKIESQVLDSVHARVRGVISTGGGLVMQDQNWSKLQTGCLVVYLDVDPEVIIKRIAGTDRPLLQTENPLETLKNLMKERSPRYEQADVSVGITADMDVQMTVDKCVRMLHDFIDENPPVWKQAKQ